MGLLIAYQMIVIIVVPTQCTPLKKLWDFTGQVEGHCINANAFYHGNYIARIRLCISLLCKATSAFHIFIDLWILALPIKLIFSIPRPSREKLAIYIIFGLGVISTLASIIRLQSLRIFTLSNDPFFDSLPINTWSMVEVNIGIMCASIPSLKPLLSRAQRRNNRQTFGDRKYDSWSSESKAPILKTGKDLMISLHPGTLKSKSMDEEWELDDRPPPPPPKDAKFGAMRQAAEYRKIVRFPDTVFIR
jgi:hypothetical protein